MDVWTQPKIRPLGQALSIPGLSIFSYTFMTYVKLRPEFNICSRITVGLIDPKKFEFLDLEH